MMNQDQEVTEDVLRQKVVDGLLVHKTPRDLQEELEAWIRLDTDISAKYKHIDLRSLVTENFKNSDWSKHLVSALGEAENCGTKLLRPTANMPILWGSVGKSSRSYKTMDKVQNGISILKQLGFTEETPNQLCFPNFPDGVDEQRDHIAMVTAEVVLARKEIDEYKKENHPRAHLITDCLEPQEPDKTEEIAEDDDESFIRITETQTSGNIELIEEPALDKATQNKIETEEKVDEKSAVVETLGPSEISFEIIRKDEEHLVAKDDTICGDICSLTDRTVSAKLHKTVKLMDSVPETNIEHMKDIIPDPLKTESDDDELFVDAQSETAEHIQIEVVKETMPKQETGTKNEPQRDALLDELAKITGRQPKETQKELVKDHNLIELEEEDYTMNIDGHSLAKLMANISEMVEDAGSNEENPDVASLKEKIDLSIKAETERKITTPTQEKDDHKTMLDDLMQFEEDKPTHKKELNEIKDDMSYKSKIPIELLQGDKINNPGVPSPAETGARPKDRTNIHTQPMKCLTDKKQSVDIKQSLEKRLVTMKDDKKQQRKYIFDDMSRKTPGKIKDEIDSERKTIFITDVNPKRHNEAQKLLNFIVPENNDAILPSALNSRSWQPGIAIRKSEQTGEAKDIVTKPVVETAKTKPNPNKISKKPNATEMKELSNELCKVERQQTAVEDMIRKIIIKDDNFLENEDYISLMKKQDRQRDRSEEIKRHLGIKSNDELADYRRQVNTRKTEAKQEKAKPKVDQAVADTANSKNIPNTPEHIGPNMQTINSTTPGRSSDAVYELDFNPNLQYLNVDSTAKKPPSGERGQETMLKPDTWQCQNCDFINDAYSESCDVCSEPNMNRSLTNIDQTNTNSKLWKCTFCTIENVPEARICIACGKTKSTDSHTLPKENKTTQEEKFDHWTCQFCTMLNQPEEKICEVCGKSRDKAALPLVSDWECPNCGYNNAAGNHVCVKCSEMDIPGVVEGWTCQVCTVYNHDDTSVCDTCGTKAASENPRELEVADVLAFGNFDEIYVEDFIENKNLDDLQDVVNDLVALHLEPVVNRIWDEGNPDESLDYSIAPLMDDEDLRDALTDQNKNSEWRQRIAMLEGDIKDFIRAANAISLIEDDEVFGDGSIINIDRILETVKIGDGDLAGCRNRLVNECLSCGDCFPRDKLHTLTYCECLNCTDCFKNGYRVLIKSKSVLEWTCLFCKQPDLNEADKRDGHFQFLSIKLQNHLSSEPELFQLFTNKLNQWKIQGDPNFVWCASDKCDFGFLREGNRKTQCPYCNEWMCWECKIPWPVDHANKTCKEYGDWKRAEEEQMGIKKNLQEDGISCPKCKFTFELARGGCMHFKCTKCQHEFCSGCFGQFVKIPNSAKGLNCKHPRDCLYHLRDWSVQELEGLLQKGNVEFPVNEDILNENKEMCPLTITREVEVNVYKEEPCGEKVLKSGLCELHYKEHLVKVINKHRLDPVDTMDKDDTIKVLKRETIQYNEQSSTQNLRDLVKTRCILQKEPYQ